MVFGHNTNLKIAGATFHVQTEDRGESHALIDTTVYYRGRVLHRRTNNYFDLLPLDEDRQQALKLRLDDQHRTVIEDIRNGAVQLAIPEPSGSSEPPSEAKILLLELTNANSWLCGKRAKLLLAVREPNGNAVPAASIRVELEGAENFSPIQAETDAHGLSQIEFEMPHLSSSSALVIHAEHHSGAGHLRFALRAKPRVA
jgi:hypothetical protein